MLTRTRQIHRQRRLNTKCTTDFNRFPFNNFTCCLTLFPKCFSSFDHSTCALSVSGRYLALDGIYHPLRAAFPNNSTRRGSYTSQRQPGRTGLSPSRAPCSKGLGTGPMRKHPLQITTRTPKTPDFKFELLPLHSPLLGQSRLVSFPPLIDMLKFSGYPHLIRGQVLQLVARSFRIRWRRHAGHPLTTRCLGGRWPRRYIRGRARKSPKTARAGPQHQAGLEG